MRQAQSATVSWEARGCAPLKGHCRKGPVRSWNERKKGTDRETGHSGKVLATYEADPCSIPWSLARTGHQALPSVAQKREKMSENGKKRP